MSGQWTMDECECDGYLDVSRHLARGISCLVRTANGVQCSVFCVLLCSEFVLRGQRHRLRLRLRLSRSGSLSLALHGTLSSGGPAPAPTPRRRRVGGCELSSNGVDHGHRRPRRRPTSDSGASSQVDTAHCTREQERPRGVRRERPRAPHGGADENKY